MLDYNQLKKEYIAKKKKDQRRTIIKVIEKSEKNTTSQQKFFEYLTENFQLVNKIKKEVIVTSSIIAIFCINFI